MRSYVKDVLRVAAQNFYFIVKKLIQRVFVDLLFIFRRASELIVVKTFPHGFHLHSYRRSSAISPYFFNFHLEFTHERFFEILFYLGHFHKGRGNGVELERESLLICFYSKCQRSGPSLALNGAAPFPLPTLAFRVQEGGDDNMKPLMAKSGRK